MDCIELFSSLATILTAVVAVYGYGSYRRDRYSRRKQLEQYLETEKTQNPKPGHTVMHLMAKLGMTEEEIFRASFDSVRVARKVRVDPETGLAQEIIFEYRND
jgi:hypothetical protein